MGTATALARTAADPRRSVKAFHAALAAVCVARM